MQEFWEAGMLFACNSVYECMAFRLSYSLLLPSLKGSCFPQVLLEENWGQDAYGDFYEIPC